jgi:hypothetical protein
MILGNATRGFNHLYPKTPELYVESLLEFSNQNRAWLAEFGD